jgi:hypothetical protein
MLRLVTNLSSLVGLPYSEIAFRNCCSSEIAVEIAVGPDFDGEIRASKVTVGDIATVARRVVLYANMLLRQHQFFYSFIALLLLEF